MSKLVKPKKRDLRLGGRINVYLKSVASSPTGGKEYTKPGSNKK